MGKWRCAHISSNKRLYDQIVAEFNRIYQTNGTPEGMALFESTDSEGKVVTVCLTPMAVPYSDTLFDISQPWYEVDEPHEGASGGWVAGDKKAMHRLGNKP
jgi:hypothetical protein